MKSPLDKPKDLLEAIKAANDVKEDLDHAWRQGQFKKFLIHHMHSPSKAKMLISDDDQFPRLRCYRGTGFSLRLKSASVHQNENPAVVLLHVEAEWVSAEISSFEEMEGCPGAPTKTIRHQLQVPLSLLEKLNEKAFKAWAIREATRQYRSTTLEATDKIKELARLHKIDLKKIKTKK